MYNRIVSYSMLYKTVGEAERFLDSMLAGLIGRIYLLIRLSRFGGATPLRKSKQIFIAIEKLTWYSYLRSILFTGTCKIIMEQKLYKMSLLHSSNATYSVFLECKLVAPMVCFRSRKEVSMPQRRL